MTQKITFTTLRNFKMGLPIGAVSPIDFGKYQGCEAYVRESGMTYRISNMNAESAPPVGRIDGTVYINDAPIIKGKRLAEEVQSNG